jgi:peptide chain release factor 1
MTALEKENKDDPDMGEMIASELEALSNQLAELEEKLKVNTILYSAR